MPPAYNAMDQMDYISRKTADRTAEGHSEPFALQFSVFLANRVGQLHELLEALSEKKLTVLGISVVDSTDWAVVRLILDDPNVGRAALQQRSLPFTESEVLLVELADPHSLSEVCAHLLRAEINVHFAYPLALCARGTPIMVFHVDDNVLAIEMLRRHDFTLLGHEDLGHPR